MVTTISGTYTVQQYKELEDTLKTAFKQFWHGDITGEELDIIKEKTRLSNAEIKSCQYDASMEERRV